MEIEEFIKDKEEKIKEYEKIRSLAPSLWKHLFSGDEMRQAINYIKGKKNGNKRPGS